MKMGSSPPFNYTAKINEIKTLIDNNFRDGILNTIIEKVTSKYACSLIPGLAQMQSPFAGTPTLIDLDEFSEVDQSVKDLYKRCIIQYVQKCVDKNSTDLSDAAVLKIQNIKPPNGVNSEVDITNKFS
jgi:hypothetical protein